MNKRISVLLFLLPALLILVGISAIPTVRALLMSFQNRELRYQTYSFIGFENYKDMFSDPRFIHSIKISASWELITVLGVMSVAILLAVFIFEYVPPKTTRVLQTLMLLPIIVPRVSAAYIWRFIYSPITGLLNYFLGLLHIPPVAVLSNPRTAIFSVAFVDIWQWAPLFAVIILGILESRPKSQLEAARIDGANTWQLHRYVVFPSIIIPLLSLTFVKMVQSLRSFSYIYVMTEGGPGVSTETLDLYAYNTGIGLEGRISYASTMSVFLLIVTIITFAIIWNITERMVSS